MTCALHEQRAFAAFLSTSEAARGAPTGVPTPLAPYDAIATGPSLGAKNGHEVTIVLAYGDAATTREQADRLRVIAEDGTSISGTAWNELVTVEDVSADGPLVIGRFSTRKPRLWLDVVFRRDSLLATLEESLARAVGYRVQHWPRPVGQEAEVVTQLLGGHEPTGPFVGIAIGREP